MNSMSLPELIPLLRQYSAILVTGPQRSGTTIASRILVHELGYQHVDEREFNIYNDKGLREILKERKQIVIQAPAMCYLAHTFDCAVVLMRRDVDEIQRSQKRINWKWELWERRHYLFYRGPIAQAKYRYWDSVQRARCKAPFELRYESLQTHPLWIDPDQRKTFKPRQWELNT